MYYPNLLNGISSFSFSLIPYIFNTPNFMNPRLHLLSICSSQYHIVSDYIGNNYDITNKNSKIANFILKVSECIDGAGIILLSNPFIFNNIVHNFHKLDYNVILFYITTKLTSNVEIMKKISFLLSHSTIIFHYPDLILLHAFIQVRFYK